MGLFLNPNSDSFIIDLNNDIYVDKSMIIENLNNLMDKSGSNYICVSRPRRFGKTMATNLISAFYSKGCESRSLFSNLKIAQTPNWDNNLNKFNVIQIDVQAILSNIDKPKNLVKVINNSVNEELIEAFPNCKIKKNDYLGMSLTKVYNTTKEKFIIIMDEYDVMVREQVSEKAFSKYLKFLNGLFKNKLLKPAIHLAYLTGVLPIVRDKIESKLNEFTEYSMTDAGCFSGFIGFTEDEVQDLCEKHNMDFAECKRWYNGYKIGNSNAIYTPNSVVRAMANQEFGSYWTKTGSPKNIKDYITLNFEGIKDDIVTMISGGCVPVNISDFLNTLSDFQSKDDVFTYLIHLGYLGYEKHAKNILKNDDESTGLCWIPNNEIRSQWIRVLKTINDYSSVMQIIKESRTLLEETISLNEKAVADTLNKYHMFTSNPLTYNNEGALQSAISLAYFYAYNDYTIIQELPTGKGYADVVFIPVHPSHDKPALIIELKMNKTTDTALTQIKQKQYGQDLAHYTGDMLFVGINYNSDTKEHECKIEKFQK